MQQLWGSVGWGIFVVFAGMLIDKTTLRENNGFTDFSPALYTFLAFQASPVNYSIV
jgi:hypothetical protein